MSDKDPMGLVEAVTEEMQIVIDNIKENIVDAGKQVSGQTAESLKLSVKQTGQIVNINIDAEKYFPVIEKGRRPTPDKKPSREMIENIGDWAEARGMEDGAAWGIAMKINNEGTKLFREGGRKDIYSPYFQPDYLRGVVERVTKVAAKGFAANLRTALKK